MTDRRITSHVVLAAWNFALLLAIYSACRLVFLFMHRPLFRAADPLKLLQSLALGCRFDLSVLALINAPYVLLLWLDAAGLNRYLPRRILHLWFVISNAFFIGLNLADVDYVRITGNRLSGELWSLRADVGRELSALVLLHWPLTLTAILLVGLLAWFYRGPVDYPKARRRVKDAVAFVVLIPLLILAQRGGLQLKPLHPGDAFAQRTPELAMLSLNAPFTFLHGLRRQTLERMHYFPDEASALAASGRQPSEPRTGAPRRDNVVIIVVESLASEYMGFGNNRPGFTPFLDSLASLGLACPVHFANGRRSIESLSAILAGIPSLMDEAFVTSRYQTNRIVGIGGLLADRGYETAFFHGGKNGTMSFDALVGHAGFAHYYGLNEYPRREDFDGHWGIFDGPYLQYVVHRLDSMAQPFLAGVFTLSSHEPYTIPSAYRDSFPTGDLPIHASIGYADRALREFFRTASTRPWYRETLFIVTGDHTQESSRRAYQNVLGHHKVPLILFHPGQRLDTTHHVRVAEHTDIAPTILDYLGLPGGERFRFSTSVLSDRRGWALLRDHGNYRLVSDSLVVRMNQDGHLAYFSPGDDPDETRPLEPCQAYAAAGKRLLAFVQLFNNQMLDNTLSDPRP